jgi:RNA polymerase sigma factor (sigma-70 family)
VTQIVSSELDAALHAAGVCSRRFAKRKPNGDADELMSVAMLGIAQAASRFDGRLGVRFSSYAEHRIFGSIKDHFRRQSHGLRGTLIECVPVESLRTLASRDSIMASIQAWDILRRLDFRKRTVLVDHYIFGYSAAEMSARSGVKEGTIDRQIERAVQAARAL